MGVQCIDTQTQLPRPLLLSCRVCLPCVGKVYTCTQAEPGPTRLLPNHLGLPQTNELGQCTPTGRYRSSSHKARRTYSRLHLFTTRLNCREPIGSRPCIVHCPDYTTTRSTPSDSLNAAGVYAPWCHLVFRHASVMTAVVIG